MSNPCDSEVVVGVRELWTVISQAGWIFVTSACLLTNWFFALVTMSLPKHFIFLFVVVKFVLCQHVNSFFCQKACRWSLVQYYLNRVLGAWGSTFKLTLCVSLVCLSVVSQRMQCRVLKRSQILIHDAFCELFFLSQIVKCLCKFNIDQHVDCIEASAVDVFIFCWLWLVTVWFGAFVLSIMKGHVIILFL